MFYLLYMSASVCQTFNLEYISIRWPVKHTQKSQIVLCFLLMSTGLYSLLTIDLFCQGFIESALKDNLGYFQQWVLISCLHDNFSTVELYSL